MAITNLLQLARCRHQALTAGIDVELPSFNVTVQVWKKLWKGEILRSLIQPLTSPEQIELGSLKIPMWMRML